MTWLTEVSLRVGDAKQRDVARGIARIDQKTMEKLSVSAGDVIEIIGKRRTSAIAWPAYSEDQGLEQLGLPNNEFYVQNKVKGARFFSPSG
ncbi:hypothetical protein KEJ18_04760, partial [Candidatus Bathyarchaeota archaeon]|nr:hypothetical protein [Candidatus Bathyarchaeota archaeon]